MSQNKFHVNSAGEPGSCSAQISCPFGSSEEHFSTKDEARAFYEKNNAEKLVPQTMSKSELNRVVKDTKDAEVLLHGATNGTDRTRGNLIKNPNATAEALVAVRDNTEDDSLKLNAQLHNNFPPEKLDDSALQTVKKMLEEDVVQPNRQKGNTIAHRIYSSDNLNDEEFDRVTEVLGEHARLKTAVGNSDNKLTVDKIVSIAESEPEDKNNYLLEAAIKKNPKYPVADRIEHLSPSTVSDLAGYVKDPDALRNIVKYPPYKSTRMQTLYRLAMNPATPSDALEAIAKEDKSAATGKYLYKHPNTTRKLKNSLTDRSPELQSLARIDELRERSPEVMGNFESSIKPIPDVNVSVHKFQFDPEVRKHTKLSDEDVETYAKNTIYPNGKYDPETNIFTYVTTPGGNWTGD